MDHIPTVSLFESARLKRELSPEAQSHLAACDVCRNELSWMEVAGSMDMEDPPQFLLDKVVQAGHNRSRLRYLSNVISALLTFDSLNLSPVGVRSDPAAARQMTFEGDDVEIGIWLR